MLPYLNADSIRIAINKSVYLLLVLRISGRKFLIIVILFVCRTVVMACELFPVKLFQISVSLVALEKTDKQFQLSPLVFRHQAHELVHTLASACPVVEAHNLCQSLACGRVRRLAVNDAGTFQTLILAHTALIVRLRPFGIENVLVAFLIVSGGKTAL